VSASGRTEQLAQFIVGAKPTTEAIAAAAMPIVDSIGAMLAGRDSDAGKLALDYARRNGTSGQAWVAGLPEGTSAETAALAGATIGHALDYDDSYPGAGHPSVPMLSSVLAAATMRDIPITGAELLDAFVVGFEVMAKFADALAVGHYYKGWHVTCTSGTFGATAAAARLLGFDKATTLTALGIAGSLASGMQRNFGTTTKPLHSGLAARNGVLAASLAQLGASADTAILDGERGFFDLYGQDRAEPALLDGLGAPYALVSPGTAIKKYPCCFIAVRPIDALLRIRAAHGLGPDDVESVICSVPLRALHAMIYPRPKTGLEGKFSTEYILAAALCDGAIGLRSFTDEVVKRPEIVAAMEKIVTREEARLRPEDPDAKVSGPAKGGWIEIAVKTRDGRSFIEAEHHPHGGPKNPFGWGDVRAKFLDCAAFGGYGAARAERLFDDFEGIGKSADVLQLLRAFTRQE
jgi:2-methylcitrate dehydratase PrpD